jgi:hypothetical protein
MNGKSYIHYYLEKEGYGRTAVMEVDAKRVGDVLVINGENWPIVEISTGPFLSEQVYKEHLKYDDNHFYTDPKRIFKVVDSTTIEDGKMYHEIFTYDNEYTLDVWYENRMYLGILTSKDKSFEEKLESPTMFEPIFGRDAWDFGILFSHAEDIMSKLYIDSKH